MHEGTLCCWSADAAAAIMRHPLASQAAPVISEASPLASAVAERASGEHRVPAVHEIRAGTLEARFPCCNGVCRGRTARSCAVSKHKGWHRVHPPSIDFSRSSRSDRRLVNSAASFMEPIISDALEAAAARDWEGLKLLLHPYLHWSEPEGVSLRGRANVLRWLASRQTSLSAPQRFELRDGQIYRWAG